MLDKMSETLELVNLSDKRLFRAGDQLLSIVPKEAQVGDEVFCFEGLETAYNLRSAGTQIVDGKGRQACYGLLDTPMLIDSRRRHSGKEPGGMYTVVSGQQTSVVTMASVWIEIGCLPMNCMQE